MVRCCWSYTLKAILRFALPVFLLASPAIGQTLWNEYPNLSDTNAKIDALLQVNQTYPSLLEDSTAYDRDLLELLQSHNSYRDAVSKRSDLFKGLVSREGNLRRYLLQLLKPEMITLRRIKPDVIPTWKNDLLATIDSLPKHKFGERALSALVAEMAAHPAGQSNGFLTGLIQALPPENKKEAFQADFAGRLAILEKNLPDSLERTSFQAERFGLTTSGLTKKGALEHLLNLHRHDQRVLFAMELLLLFPSFEGTLSELRSTVDGLNEGSLAAMIDIEQRKERLKLLSDSGLLDPIRTQLKPLTDQLEVRVKAMSETVTEETKVFQPRLMFTETSAFLAQFRGYAGNDCATLYSAGFANSPSEWVFIISSPEGGVKGYAAASDVVSDGKHTLYLHTINGPRLSAADVEMTLQFFADFAERRKMSVVLPTEQRVHANMNFQVIRDVMNRHAENVIRKIGYPDANLRAFIKTETGITRNYDDPASNTQARALVLKKNPDVQTKTTNVSATTAQHSPIDYIILAYGLRRAGRLKGETLATISRKLDSESVRQLLVIVDNPDELSAEKHIERLRTEFAKVKIELTPQILEKYWAVFVTGLVRNKEAFNSAHSEMLSKWVERALGVENESILREVFLHHREKLLTSPSLSKRLAGSEDLRNILTGLGLSSMKWFDSMIEQYHAQNGAQLELSQGQKSREAYQRVVQKMKTVDEIINYTARIPVEIKERVITDSFEHFLDLNPSNAKIRLYLAQSGSIDTIIALKRRVLYERNAPADFIELSALSREKTSDGYKNANRAMIMSLADEFLHLNPSNEQIKSLLVRERAMDVIEAFYEAILHRPPTPDSLAFLTGFVFDKPSDFYKEFVADFVVKNAVKLRNGGADLSAIFKAASGRNTADSYLLLRKKLLLDSKTWTQAAEVLKNQYGVDKPNDAYKERFKKMMIEVWPHLLKLAPSVDVLAWPLSRIEDNGFSAKYRNELLGRAKTLNEFLKAAPLASSLNTESVNLRKAWVSENLDRLLALSDASSKPKLLGYASSTEELHKILKTLPKDMDVADTVRNTDVARLRVQSIEIRDFFFSTAKSWKTVSEVIALGYNFEKPSDSFKAEMQTLITKKFSQLSTLAPSVQEAARLLPFADNGSFNSQMRDQLLTRVKTSEDFLALAQVSGQISTEARQQREAWLNTHRDKIESLKFNFADGRTLLAFSNDMTIVELLHRKWTREAATIGDLKEALTVAKENPSAKYLELLSRLLLEKSDWIARQDLPPKELAEFLTITKDANAIGEIVSKAMGEWTKSQLLEFGRSTLPSLKMANGNAVFDGPRYDALWMTFISRDPSNAEIREFVTAVPDLKTRVASAIRSRLSTLEWARVVAARAFISDADTNLILKYKNLHEIPGVARPAPLRKAEPIAAGCRGFFGQ